MAHFSAIDSVWSDFGRPTTESRRASVERYAPVPSAPPPQQPPPPQLLPPPQQPTAAPEVTKLLREGYDAFDEAIDISCGELLPTTRTGRLVCLIAVAVLFAMLISLHCKVSKLLAMSSATPHPLMHHRW